MRGGQPDNGRYSTVNETRRYHNQSHTQQPHRDGLHMNAGREGGGKRRLEINLGLGLERDRGFAMVEFLVAADYKERVMRERIQSGQEKEEKKKKRNQ